jgi:multidrug efflux pump subunit AcrA (membrane-fusion protein)
MLNISDTPQGIQDGVKHSKTMDTLSDDTKGVKVVRILVTSLVVIFLMLLLPWTQNVVATGKIISRYPDKKPQQVNTMIDGRIVKWFAYEGQNVAKGDTILILEEVKPEYLDPQLVQRTRELIEAKINGVAAYRDKIVALQDQELALQQARDLELSQARLKVDQSVQKVQADSAMVRQEELNIQIERERLSRAEELFKDGLITTTDFESRSLKLQESDAKFIKARNDYEVSKQSYEMAVLEVRRKAADFADKLAKNRSDQATTQAMLQDGIAERTKLENSLVNYINRETGRVVLAPQEGRIVAAVSSGMGEIVKAGTSVVTIQPLEFIEAAELYVEAMDVPILHPGAKARLQLDGWPALVFSGWPSASIGTFGAEVVSVDQVINQKGKYRVILAPDPDEGPWPRPISIGSGALGILLLKDVPLGYELWRQLNGFPPEFYTEEDLNKDSGEEKK